MTVVLSVVPERVAAFGHTSSQQPTPPASARWRLVCRRESIARLAKSGSYRRAPPRLRPVAAGARASQAAPPALAPLALRHRAQPPPSFAKLRAPASGTMRPTPPTAFARPAPPHRACGPRRCGCCAPLRLAPSLPPLESQPLLRRGRSGSARVKASSP